MTLFQNLPEEVLLLILEHLGREGRPTTDLKSLRLVGRRFSALACDLLFRHVTIWLGCALLEDHAHLNKRSVALLTFLLGNQHCRSQVQALSILRFFESQQTDSEEEMWIANTIAILLPLLPRANHIRSVICHRLQDVTER